MKEHPILFSGPMVKAILEGRKTQTRRVLKRQPQCDHLSYTEADWKHDPTKYEADGDRWRCSLCGDGVWMGNWKGVKCPYGQVGDRLWVRETHCKVCHECLPSPPFCVASKICYRADFTESPCPDYATWTPSIHMKREYSRITLEITGVKVERIQDISNADIKAEGCEVMGSWPTDNFPMLWNTINFKRGYGWGVNPWCWCLTFRVVP